MTGGHPCALDLDEDAEEGGTGGAVWAGGGEAWA